MRQKIWLLKTKRLTPICKLWTKNSQTGYMTERHLWTKNPHEIQKLIFGNVVERHLWTKNPHKFFFKKITSFGISCSVICGQKTTLISWNISYFCSINHNLKQNKSSKITVDFLSTNDAPRRPQNVSDRG